MQPLASRVYAPLHAALLAVLAADGACAEPTADNRVTPMLTLESVRVEDWASLTFEGQKHWIELRLDGPEAAIERAGAVIAARTGDIEFDLPGQIVADIALVSTAMVRGGAIASRRLRFELLTISD